MNWQKKPLIFLFCLPVFLTCGIEDYYYLPQVPERGITRRFNTEATVNMPPLSEFYATGYVVFYKIYTSDNDNDNIDILRTFPRISIDYGALLPYTDPSNATSLPSITTFSSRGFYELELEGANIRNTVLSKSGGTFKILFPPSSGNHPSIEFDGDTYFLLRSNGAGAFNPRPADRWFFSSDDLKNFDNATATVNADVSGQSGIPEFAYASMYIAAVGQNPSNFTKLYGKPTHISIFKLTPLN